MKFKYLIVGQGIAGSLIALECLKRDLSFMIIDDPSQSQASRIAAGIINPVTGRKYVKTWMYEALEKVFIPTYQAFEDLLGKKYLLNKAIIRAFPKISDQNNWDARSISDDGAPYMRPLDNFDDFEDKVVDRIGYGMVKGYQLKVGELLNDFRDYLREKGLFLKLNFDHSELEKHDAEFHYKDFMFAHLIFCEGYKAVENPYFKDLPFALAKGELLLVEIPDLKSERILKDGIFLVHLGNQIFWAGATYAWDDLNEKPSSEKKEMLIKALNKVLKVPYEILDHKAGVRPSTEYRRPFLGTHPRERAVHVFNGLGTKGSSLGPYWAAHFMNYLEDGKVLDPEVDIVKYL